MDQSQALQLAMELMAIDTTNPPGNQEGAVNCLSEFMKDRGMSHEIEWIDGVPNLFCTLEFSQEGPSVCWIGHWDVVPPGDVSGWTLTQPFTPRILDGLLFGRGACDMKTGIASGVCAASSLLPFREQLSGRLILAIVGDEETGGGRGAAPLLPMYHDRYRFDYGIVGEPTGFELKIARRGACLGTIEFLGIQAHAARPHEGDNPIIKMGRGITALNSVTLTAEPNALFGPPTLSITTARSGEKDNVIPQRAKIGFDMRIVPGQSRESLTRDIHRALGETGLQPDKDYLLHLGSLTSPYRTTDPDFISLCQEEMHLVLGYRPALNGTGGTSDGRFLANLGVPVVEIGLENTTLHKVDECCNVESIFRLEKIYQRIFVRLLSEYKKPG